MPMAIRTEYRKAAADKVPFHRFELGIRFSCRLTAMGNDTPASNAR